MGKLYHGLDYRYAYKMDYGYYFNNMLTSQIVIIYSSYHNFLILVLYPDEKYNLNWWNKNIM